MYMCDRENMASGVGGGGGGGETVGLPCRHHHRRSQSHILPRSHHRQMTRSAKQTTRIQG